MDCPTTLENYPMAMGLEEWLVLRVARLGTQQEQELVPRLQQRLKRQNTQVPEDPELSLVQFLGSEALQGPGLPLLLRRLLRRRPNMGLLEAWCPVCQVLVGSQVLECQGLQESQVLESQGLGSQELCHQLQLLKLPPRPLNMGPEQE